MTDQYLRQQCQSLREDWDGTCSVTDIMQRSADFVKWDRNHCYEGFACDHVFGRGHDSMSAWCCMAMLRTSPHEFKHQCGSPKAKLIVEACCLWANYQRHQRLLRVSPQLINKNPARQYWNLEMLDIARTHCTVYRTIQSRIEHLHEELSGTPFGDVSGRLLEVVT